nr:transposon Ty3-I Gag-Pol polyprotein [Tanacetum cinerariifolium]
MEHYDWFKRVAAIREAHLILKITLNLVKKKHNMGKRDCHTGNPCEPEIDPMAQIQDRMKILEDEASITAINRSFQLGISGTAVEWFRWMSRNGLITTWDRFVESVKNHFGPSKYEDPQGALSKLLKLRTRKFLVSEPTTLGDVFSWDELPSLAWMTKQIWRWIVGFNFEGTAVEWFRWMSRNGLITTWDRFVESVKNHFGPSKYEDPQGALSKLLKLRTRKFLVSEPTTLGDVFSWDELPRLAWMTKQIWRWLGNRIGISDVHGRMDNKGSHNFVHLNAGERMHIQAMVTGQPYQGVGGSPKEATWEWMSDSQSAYSPYHLEGKVTFIGVGNVTPWAANDDRRKKVKCYVQGNERQKREKVIGRGSGSPNSTSRILNIRGRYFTVQ